jgi:hypothetical protein
MKVFEVAENLGFLDKNECVLSKIVCNPLDHLQTLAKKAYEP